jgi:hypothetical protein
MIETLILKLTHKMWNRQISRILCRAKADGVINSKQLHEMAAAFDPTQKHQVYGKFKAAGFLPRLLAVACLLLLIGCNHSPSADIKARAAELSSGFRKQAEAITTKQDESLAILRENTAALQTIKSLSDKQMELDTEIVSLLKASMVKSEPQREEVVKSAPEPQGNERDSQNTPSVPRSTPAVQSSPVKMSWNIDGNWNPTIIETANHLRDEHGVNIDGMTHQQLHDLHASLHNGTKTAAKPVAVKSVPVQIINRGTSCPGGQCPMPRQVKVKRRR